MSERLIITNGDSAADGLRSAGIAAEILPWRDMLHDGPVPALPLEELSRIRARFLAEDFTPAGADVDDAFAARDATLRNHRAYRRIELWFEHDLFDQLQLIQILDALSERSEGLLLLQADDYLGPMSAQALRALDGTAKPVTPAQMGAARAAWAAFTANGPEALATIAAEPSSLPFLPAALRRLLAELPDVHSGLSLTEQRIVAALAHEASTVGLLFKTTSEQEDARFLGDAPFFRRIDGLAFSPTPLIAGVPFPSSRCRGGPENPDYGIFARSKIALTEAGHAALAGRFDHAIENRIERWFGGTHLTRDNMWRRDDNGPVRPLH